MKTMAMLLGLAAGVLSAPAAETTAVHHACCAQHAEAEAAPAGLSGKSLYQMEATWTNDHGAAVKLATLRGRPQIVTMFFANCNYACPLLVYQMQQIEAALPEAVRKQVGFTLVSFDTERDTPTALHSYRLQHELGEERWTLLRGAPEDVLELAASLNVKFKKDAQGQFLHSNVITLLNAEGEVVWQQVGLTANKDEMVRRVSELVRN
jgi:protein SCO1